MGRPTVGEDIYCWLSAAHQRQGGQVSDLNMRQLRPDVGGGQSAALPNACMDQSCLRTRILQADGDTATPVEAASHGCPRSGDTKGFPDGALLRWCSIFGRNRQEPGWFSAYTPHRVLLPSFLTRPCDRDISLQFPKRGRRTSQNLFLSRGLPMRWESCQGKRPILLHPPPLPPPLLPQLPATSPCPRATGGSCRTASRSEIQA